MQDLVSIIVPVYKTERYLQRCVNSILRQNYAKLEIILVDDGSPDASGDLCDKLATNDNRIHVIHKTNGGLSSARNAGIDASYGKYICFVDSDDYVEKDYVSTLLNLCRTYNADLAKIDYIEISTDDYSEKPSIVEALVFEGKEVESAFLKLRVDSACVFMYKKSLIGDTRFQERKTSEDIPFNFEIFQKANRFVYMPINKYYYWHNPDSISNGPLDRNMLNYLDFRKDIYEYYLQRDDKELIRMAEVLYARAAMGLMARMAIYGISENMDEGECKLNFRKVFNNHSKAFYSDRGTKFNRKVLASFTFNFYPVVSLARLLTRR